MAPKDAKKAGGKKASKKGGADAGGAEREARDREDIEETYRREQEAEERQKLENELRDKLEHKERKRLKKEAQAAALAEKEVAINTLTQQYQDLDRRHTVMKTEMEDELERTTHLKNSLENELSQLQCEHHEVLKERDEERATTKMEMRKMEENIKTLRGQNDDVSRELELVCTDLNGKLTRATAEIQLLRNAKDDLKVELGGRIEELEAELEKSNGLNKTLQAVVEEREAEDKKNVTLMQLLNGQLAEQKERFEGMLADELSKARSLSQDLTQTKHTLAHVEGERDTLQKDLEQMTRDKEQEVADVTRKLEQLKFDTKFLHSELNIYKSKHAKAQAMNEQLEQGAVASVEHIRLEAETAAGKIAQLEQTLRNKERDQFDRVTFLNAQISHNRQTIAELHAKLQAFKETHISEVGTLNEKVFSGTEKLVRAQSAHDKSRMSLTEAEAKSNADLASLKTAIFQLQSALVDKERDFSESIRDRDMELHRLRRKLDEAFIPHRLDPLDSKDDQKSLEWNLREKVSKLATELEGKSQETEDMEVRMNSQINNLNAIIESLQVDLQAKDEDTFIKMRVLTEENGKLRGALEQLELDANYVSYRAS